MRGLKQDGSARIIIAGHAFVQNARRGHYELGVDASASRRMTVAFGELAAEIWGQMDIAALASLGIASCNRAIRIAGPDPILNVV